jgi:hypothetical protein
MIPAGQSAVGIIWQRRILRDMAEVLAKTLTLARSSVKAIKYPAPL